MRNGSVITLLITISLLLASPAFLVIENSWDDWDVANPYYHTFEDASDRLANDSPTGVTYDYPFATDVTRAAVALLAQEAVPIP